MLVLKAVNVSRNSGNSVASYRVEVYVNAKQLATFSVQGFERKLGWRVLLSQIAEAAKVHHAT